MVTALLQWLRAHGGVASTAVVVCGCVAVAVIRELGKTARARLKYRLPQLQHVPGALDQQVPKLLKGRRGSREGRRDQQPGTTSRRSRSVVEVDVTGEQHR